MHYGNLDKTDIADGPGVRVTLFVSGCPIHCRGCQNECAWDFKYGKEVTKDIINDIIAALKPDYIDGFTLCGGEPFAKENQMLCYTILKTIKTIYPNKSIWCYSGYYLETIPNTEYKNKMLELIDVLVEGPYVEELRDITSFNAWRGSTNQKIIDMKQTLKQNTKIYLKGMPNNCI